MENDSKKYKILPYYSSKEGLPISFRVNKRNTPNEKIRYYKSLADDKNIRDEDVYNPYIINIFKNSIKIRKK